MEVPQNYNLNLLKLNHSINTLIYYNIIGRNNSLKGK